MNLPLRLTECSHPISLVSVTLLAIRQQHFGKPFAAVGVRFIVPAYTYSQRIRNPFRIHSRNVRHAFRGRTLHY